MRSEGARAKTGSRSTGPKGSDNNLRRAPDTVSPKAMGGCYDLKPRGLTHIRFIESVL